MNFAFLAFPDVEELDLIGPWEILAGGLKAQEKIEEAFIVTETGEPFRCAKGLEIVPHYDFANCPTFEYLLVPGGWGSRQQATNPRFISFLKERAKSCRAVLSVCTGAFLLAEAGLLEGKKATTHWSSLDRLRDFGGVDVVEERFVRDGSIWSSAGVSAGIDLSLEFIKEEFDETTAEAIQFYAEFYPVGTVYGKPEAKPEAPKYLKKSAPD